MNSESGKITIILAHPNINESRANKELIDTVKEIDSVVVYNIYEDFVELFDPEVWTQIMLESTALIFQFPLNWMSAPYMLKKWQEEVFTHLSRTPVVIGKSMMVVTTVGSSQDSYRSGGKNCFTMDEILRPYQASAINAGMKWETPIIVYDMTGENIGKSLSEGAILYKERVEKLKSATNVMVLSDW